MLFRAVGQSKSHSGPFRPERHLPALVVQYPVSWLASASRSDPVPGAGYQEPAFGKTERPRLLLLLCSFELIADDRLPGLGNQFHLIVLSGHPGPLRYLAGRPAFFKSLTVGLVRGHLACRMPYPKRLPPRSSGVAFGTIRSIGVNTCVWRLRPVPSGSVLSCCVGSRSGKMQTERTHLNLRKPL